MARVLVVDDREGSGDRFAAALRDAGFDVATSVEVDAHTFFVEALVVVWSGDEGEPLPPVATGEAAQSLVVIAVAEQLRPDVWLQAAVDGAVRCIPVAAGPGAVVAALHAALDPDAPPVAEQRRLARVRALKSLARADAVAGDEDSPRSVRLTRLEHGPVRTLPVDPRGPSAASVCTEKQLEMLDAIVRAGSVSKAAEQLGTSRSSMYAALRRIAHRMQLRDSGELLRTLAIAARAEHG